MPLKFDPKVLLKKKLLVVVAGAGLASLGIVLPPEALDAIVTVGLGFIGG